MSFIRDFFLHNQGNEIPKRYLLWSAYGALSSAIGPRVHIDLHHIYVTPNIYIILVGKAGGRKTSARDKAYDLVVEALPSLTFSGDNDTYQGIITAMERDTTRVNYVNERGEQAFYRPYCIFSPEFPDYLQNNPIGMIAFITNIYDRDRRHYIYRLKNEDRVLTFPYVTILACAPIEWFTDQIKAKQFAAGFGRRTVLVCNEGYTRKEPTITQAERDAWIRCVEHLRRVQGIVGPMLIEPNAKEWFWKWYINPQPLPSDSFLEAWRESWHIILLKVAMLISLSERSDRVVTIDYLQLALEQLLDIEENLPLVTEHLGRSEITKPLAHVLHILRLNGGFMPEKLLKANTFKEFRDSREQWSAIEHLKRTDQVVAIEKADDKGIVRLYIALPQCVVRSSPPPASPSASLPTLAAAPSLSELTAASAARVESAPPNHSPVEESVP